MSLIPVMAKLNFQHHSSSVTWSFRILFRVIWLIPTVFWKLEPLGSHWRALYGEKC